jgi:tRNA-dihydrouridine synthase
MKMHENDRTATREGVADNVYRHHLLLAPLRGVTIRTFRNVFSSVMEECGFTGAIAPFIPANPGIRFSTKLFADIAPLDKSNDSSSIPLVPQVIGKDPSALREWCKMVKDIGFSRADLNAGCPFPMIRKKGRGSGLLRNPDTLEKMLEAGCDEMGDGNFSLKTRLGMDSVDELKHLIPVINRYPITFLTVHARTARQMYDGDPHREAFEIVRNIATSPVIYNGDATAQNASLEATMVGRDFIRRLGKRADARELLSRYLEESCMELCGDAPVLGRMKELLSYWCLEPEWNRIWPTIKICRSVAELKLACRLYG